MKNESSPDYRFLAGWIAVLGALIGTVADTFLLYNPTGGYFSGDYLFLKDVEPSRMIWGHYLGIMAIPLEAAGIYLVYLALAPKGKKLALACAVLGVYLIFPGVAYHATVFPLADAVRMQSPLLAQWIAFSEPLGLVFAVAFLILFIPLTIWVGQGKTLWPRWMVFVSPLLTYPIWILLSFALPDVGNFLAPMGFNLSMAILFGTVLFRQYKVG